MTVLIEHERTAELLKHQREKQNCHDRNYRNAATQRKRETECLCLARERQNCRYVTLKLSRIAFREHQKKAELP
jgi:ribosomal protein S14